jgi:tetratricopeptide (TPR) repeat protein
MDDIRLEVAGYHLAVALVYSLEHRTADAIAEYNRAIQINPESAWAFFGRAECYEDLGEHECALEDYTESIRLDSGYPEASAGRAQVHYKLMREDIALTEQIIQRVRKQAKERGNIDPYYSYLHETLDGLYRLELKEIKHARNKYMLAAGSDWDGIDQANSNGNQFHNN